MPRTKIIEERDNNHSIHNSLRLLRTVMQVLSGVYEHSFRFYPKLQLTNSNKYNNSLKQRGRIDFWMDTSIISKWRYTGKQIQGGKVLYSDAHHRNDVSVILRGGDQHDQSSQLKSI